MVPAVNAGMTRIAHPGLQVVVLLVIAGVVLKNGIGMVVLDQKLIPNLVVNTIYQDGGPYTTFRAFSPTQPEETHSMVTAN